MTRRTWVLALACFALLVGVFPFAVRWVWLKRDLGRECYDQIAVGMHYRDARRVVATFGLAVKQDEWWTFFLAAAPAAGYAWGYDPSQVMEPPGQDQVVLATDAVGLGCPPAEPYPLLAASAAFPDRGLEGLGEGWVFRDGSRFRVRYGRGDVVVSCEWVAGLRESPFKVIRMRLNRWWGR
jgi:hypothetical protein